MKPKVQNSTFWFYLLLLIVFTTLISSSVTMLLTLKQVKDLQQSIKTLQAVDLQVLRRLGIFQSPDGGL